MLPAHPPEGKELVANAIEIIVLSTNFSCLKCNFLLVFSVFWTKGVSSAEGGLASLDLVAHRLQTRVRHDKTFDPFEVQHG